MIYMTRSCTERFEISPIITIIAASSIVVYAEGSVHSCCRHYQNVDIYMNIYMNEHDDIANVRCYQSFCTIRAHTWHRDIMNDFMHLQAIHSFVIFLISYDSINDMFKCSAMHSFSNILYIYCSVLAANKCEINELYIQRTEHLDEYVFVG